MTQQSSSAAAGDGLARALQAGRDVVHGRGTGTYDDATDAIHLLLAAVPGAVEGAREAIAQAAEVLKTYSHVFGVLTDDDRKKLSNAAALLTSRPDGVASVEQDDEEDRLAEMAAFGASEAACIFYPGEHQQPERAAYCAGAAAGARAIHRHQPDDIRYSPVPSLTAAPSESVGLTQGSPAWCAEVNASIYKMIHNADGVQGSTAPKSGEVGELREALAEVMPYLEQGYMDDEDDDEPIGWCSDHDGTNQRPLPLTFGMIRRCRAALAKAPPTNGGEIAGVERPYPELLSKDEARSLLDRAENLWRDLQANNLGGFSGCNRPFWILAEFKSVIEAFGHRDVGLKWSKNDLDAALSALAPATEKE